MTPSVQVCHSSFLYLVRFVKPSKGNCYISLKTLFAGEINSRHPAILGLRNVLKTACSNDITTLTVPLLLAHHITEVHLFLINIAYIKSLLLKLCTVVANKKFLLLLGNDCCLVCQKSRTCTQMCERVHD